MPAAAGDDKGLKTAEPQQGTVTEGASPDAEEPVVLRKKKPPATTEIEKTPSPEETTDGPTVSNKNLWKDKKFKTPFSG